MARTDALSIYLNETDKDKLSEIQGGVIEAIQRGAISEQIKNKNYSGDPTSGSVEVSRFANATVNTKGTARTAGKGANLENSGKVTINVDTDKEIIEEAAKKDVDLMGIPAILTRRKGNHVKRMIADLDRTFFSVAEATGTAVTTTETDIEEIMEVMIQSIETVVNDFVDGVDRDMIVLTVTPKVYGMVKNYVNTIDGSHGKETYFNEVRIFSNTRQTSDIICMVDGSVGQLVKVDDYDAEKIPLSNDIAIELFYSRGTKAVMPDLIKKLATV